MRMRILSLVILVALTFSWGCGSSNVLENLSAEDRFQIAKKKFDNESYFDAIEDFRVITLQFPGSAVADSAQFLLAECYYHRDQFILSASEYETLIRTMSTSKFVPTARYQIGMCYYALSPSSELDQKNSHKALDALQSFIEYHPTSPLVPQAEAKIMELNTKLAKKEYDSGVIYMKMENYKAAERQFDFVIEKYHDTEYAPLAVIGKIEALIVRKKYADAKKEVDRFLERYPESPLKERAASLKRQIEGSLQGRTEPKADGTAANAKPTSKSEVK